MKNMKKKKGCVRGDGVRADAGLAIPGARRMARPVRSHRYRRGDARLGDVRTCRERITKAGLLSHLATFWLIISLQVQGPAVGPRPLKHAACHACARGMLRGVPRCSAPRTSCTFLLMQHRRVARSLPLPPSPLFKVNLFRAIKHPF